MGEKHRRDYTINTHQQGGVQVLCYLPKNGVTIFYNSFHPVEGEQIKFGAGDVKYREGMAFEQGKGNESHEPARP